MACYLQKRQGSFQHRTTWPLITVVLATVHLPNSGTPLRVGRNISRIFFHPPPKKNSKSPGFLSGFSFQQLSTSRFFRSTSRSARWGWRLFDRRKWWPEMVNYWLSQWLTGLNFWGLPSRSLTWPLKSYLPNRKRVFQPPFFRGYVKLRGITYFVGKIKFKLLFHGPKWLSKTNIAGWNIPIFNRKYIDSIRGPHFPANYVSLRKYLFFTPFADYHLGFGNAK